MPVHRGRAKLLQRIPSGGGSSAMAGRKRARRNKNFESIRAKEQPGRQVLSEWSKNGRIGAQGWLSAAHVPPFQPLGGGGRGDSI